MALLLDRGLDGVPTWTYTELPDSLLAPRWVWFKEFRRNAARAHPTRVRAPADAQLELVCCLHRGNVGALSALPPRPSSRPYLVWMEDIRWHRCAECVDRRTRETCLSLSLIHI